MVSHDSKSDLPLAMKTKVLLVRILEDEDFVYQAENLSLQKKNKKS